MRGVARGESFCEFIMNPGTVIAALIWVLLSFTAADVLYERAPLAKTICKIETTATVRIIKNAYDFDITTVSSYPDLVASRSPPSFVTITGYKTSWLIPVVELYTPPQQTSVY